MVGQREMRRAVAQCLTQRDPLMVQCIGNPTDRRLCAFIVDIPGIEMFERPAFIRISGEWMIAPAFINAPDNASSIGSIAGYSSRNLASA